MNTPVSAPSAGKEWAAVLLLLAAATGVGLLLEAYVSLTSQAMIYVLAVVIASYRLDWVKSAACAVGAVTALNFFFVPPRWTFEVESQEHFIALLALLVVALVISRLAAGLRQETEIAQTNERRARQLQSLATELSAAASTEDVLERGRAALAAAFDGPCNLGLVGELDAMERNGEIVAAVRDGLRSCLKEGSVLGPGTGRWPGLQAWYLPLREKGEGLGAACVRPALASDDSGREHAQALCALLAQAFWRLRLTESVQHAQAEAQRQQLQSTFLAAISHDLRTPLAAIVGASSSLQTQHDKLKPAEQQRLLASIGSEASYLSALTENTLQLVRLASPGVVLRRDWEAMEEIVGAVLARVRQTEPARRIHASVPEGLPLVKADPVLLAQLLTNLLDNALKYSSDAIDLVVSASADEIKLCVLDRGPGIAPAAQQEIFKPFMRGDRAAHRGSGLGLAVCKAIADAHGGHLSLNPRAGGGSEFCLTLKLDATPPAVELP